MTLAASTIARWRGDPVAFVRQNFGVEPDEWQADALRAFAAPGVPLISLQACAGPGKSAVLAWCGWYFLACYGEPGDHPKGLCVSVSADNLSANLWVEYSKWQQRSPYLSACFTWGAERIYCNEHKSTWFLEARSWPKTASPDEQGKTISGLHGGYVLVQVDESGSIPPAVGRAAEQSQSTRPKFGKVIQAGNPLSREGMLYASANNGRWKVIRITGDPDDPKRSPRIDVEWARAQIADHGRESPWVMAYILGQFPLTAINALLGADDVRAAMARAPRGHDFEHAARIMGVDVALAGDDASVIVKRQGLMCYPPIVMRNATPSHGAGTVAFQWNEWDADACFVDNTGGFGSGWIDNLRRLRRAPIGVHFSGEPIDRRYLNKRAEMWFLMAQWVKEGGALPNVPELVAELTTPTYTFSRDRFVIEDKKLIKARLGRSPDIADALALTFAAPVQRRRAKIPGADRSVGGLSYNPVDAMKMQRGG